MGKSEERRHIKQKVEKTKSITNNLTSKAASILESLSSKIKYQSINLPKITMNAFSSDLSHH